MFHANCNLQVTFLFVAIRSKTNLDWIGFFFFCSKMTIYPKSRWLGDIFQHRIKFWQLAFCVNYSRVILGVSVHQEHASWPSTLNIHFSFQKISNVRDLNCTFFLHTKYTTEWNCINTIPFCCIFCMWTIILLYFLYIS